MCVQLLGPVPARSRSLAGPRAASLHPQHLVAHAQIGGVAADRSASDKARQRGAVAHEGDPISALRRALDPRQVLPARTGPLLALALAAATLPGTAASRRRAARARPRPPACAPPFALRADRWSSPAYRGAQAAASRAPPIAPRARTNGCSARVPRRRHVGRQRRHARHLLDRRRRTPAWPERRGPRGRTNALTNLTFCSSRSDRPCRASAHSSAR